MDNYWIIEDRYLTNPFFSANHVASLHSQVLIEQGVKERYFLSTSRRHDDSIRISSLQ